MFDYVVVVNEADGSAAAHMRSLLGSGLVPPGVFRAALAAVPVLDRDAWVDRVLGLAELPDDGPLPPGCVPYLPCSVEALLRAVKHADVQSTDRVVEIGAGLGRAALIIHFATGASVTGIEIQPQLVRAAAALLGRFNVRNVSLFEADVAERPDILGTGSVFFLYCPFGGERLERLLRELEHVARERPVRICCVDLPIPPTPWLTVTARDRDLTVYRSCR